MLLRILASMTPAKERILRAFEARSSRFTDEQIQELRDAFCMFDKDDLNFVPFQQIKELVRVVGYNPRDEALDQWSVLVDSNGDDMINFEEFVSLIDMLETDERRLKEAQDAFNAFDFLGQGFIFSHDIMEALMFIMVKAHKNDQENIIKHFHLTPNRKIYFDEFTLMITLKRNDEPSEMDSRDDTNENREGS